MTCFWNHKWKATGVEHWRETSRRASPEDIGIAKTLIRRVCQKCGEVESKEVKGIYSLEELTQSNEENENTPSL